MIDPRRKLSKKEIFMTSFDFRPLRTGKYGIRPLVVFFVLGIFMSVPTVGSPYLGLMVKHDLHLSFFTLAALGAAIQTGGIMFAGPLGYIADRTKRTFIVGLGGVINSLAVLGHGLAYTPAIYGLANATDSLAGDLQGIPRSTLMADYIPVEQRVRVNMVLSSYGRVASLLLPIPMALVVERYGWRTPFWFAWIPLMLISLYIMFFMPEPRRGYMERRALGATEEVADREQPKPSWAESWRIVWSVRTLRFLNYASVISSIGGIFTLYTGYYFIEKWHQTPAQIATIRTMEGLVSFFLIASGAGVINYISNLRPQRVLQFQSLIGVLGSLTTILIIIFPILWLNIVFTVATGALASLVAAASGALLLNVMPARARGVASSITAYFILPVIWLRPIVGGVADSIGIQNTLLLSSIFPLMGAIVTFVGARFYEYDVRNQKLSAMATEEHEKSKLLGKTKQLVCRQVDVHYGSVQVLFGVDFDVEQGELIALLGTNGAGKSTLLRAISGLSEASSGAIVFDGDDVTHIPPNEIAGKGIIYMMGGRSGFPSLTVRENLKMGSWLHGTKPDHHRDMERVFEYFPILKQRLDQVVGTLSGGEQQMLALSLAFLSRPKMLLIDELSLGLAPGIVDQLLNIVRAIHEGGTTIVVVEQSVNIALKVAKRAIFMEKGEVKFTGPTEELLNRPDILRSVFLKGATGVGKGSTISAVSGFATGGLPGTSRRGANLADQPNVLEVRGLSKNFGGRPALTNVTFDLRDSEILGIIGANGAGKTTLFDVLSGFQVQESGVILFAGEDISNWTPDARARAGLIRRFQDARLFPTLTVSEVIAIAFERQLEVRNMLMLGLNLPAARRSEKRVRAKVDSLIELMQLEAFRDKFVGELSTGSRRIVDLACVIASGPRVLLLDEPSAGIAQKESEEMGPLLQRVRHQTGCSMIVIEHDMALISQVADELLVLHLGEVMMRGEPKVVLEDERVVAAYLGGAVEAPGSLAVAGVGEG
ncbi:MAG: MFS transporter [Candidatus Dormibacteria bacterium]